MDYFLFIILVVLLISSLSHAHVYDYPIKPGSNEWGELKTELINRYNNRIVFVSDATWSYNCHAYTWYISEGKTDNVWIGTFEVPEFWEDGSYILTSSSSASSKVYYPLDDHSAVITYHNGFLLHKSKWGNGPVFIHDKNDSPYTQDVVSGTN